MWSKLGPSWWSLHRTTFTWLNLTAAVSLVLRCWDTREKVMTNCKLIFKGKILDLILTRFLRKNNHCICLGGRWHSQIKKSGWVEMLSSTLFVLWAQILGGGSSVFASLFHSQSHVWEEETPCPCPQRSVLMTSPLCVYMCVCISRAPSMCTRVLSVSQGRGRGKNLAAEKNAGLISAAYL